MRRLWQIVLPVLGLSLFGGITRAALEGRQMEKVHGQYFWWASIPLDTHRIDPKQNTVDRRTQIGEGRASWDPRVIEDRGLPTRLMLVSAFPAFFIGIACVRILGRLGVSDVSTFLVLMPLLIAAWYYLIGAVIDRWAYRRLRRQ